MRQIDENTWDLNKNQQLKKTKFGYFIMYPIKKDGKINWRNLIIGEWKFFIISILLVIIAFAYISETREARELVKEFRSDPREFCSEHLIISDPYGSQLNPFYELNLSNLTGGENEFSLSLPS